MDRGPTGLVCWAVLAAASLWGCYRTHGREGGDPARDASTSRDGAAPDDDGGDGAVRDAEGSPDAGSRCEDVDVVVREDVDRVLRAREDGVTRLVVGWFTPRTGPRPVELWDLEFDAEGRPVPHLRMTLPDTAGAQPAAAAMRFERIALALDHGDRPDELLLVDVTRGEIAGRRILDETLTAGFVTHAWLALNDTQVLSIVGLPAGGSRLRTYWREPPEIEPTGLAPFFEELHPGPAGPASALDVARAEPRVHGLLSVALERDAIDHFPLDAGLLVDIDRGSVLSIDGLAVSVDGIRRGELEPGTSTIYGLPTLAMGLREVASVATDRGLRWSSTAPGGPLAWRAPTTALLAGLPQAHADDRDAGVFFVEPALGTMPSRLRYVGERCP